jgi:DNA-binding NtrC family response regulator
MASPVLIVEPDEAIRGLLEVALRRRGREVLAVKSGSAAITAMGKTDLSCLIVGSPVVMDGDDGPVLLLEHLERHCPDRPCMIVLTTHVANSSVLSVAARLAACAVVAKPFTPGDLEALVDDCLAGRHGPTRWIGIPAAR